MTPGVSAASPILRQRLCLFETAARDSTNPDAVTVDVLNHSYIGNFVTPNNPPDLLTRSAG